MKFIKDWLRILLYNIDHYGMIHAIQYGIVMFLRLFMTVNMNFKIRDRNP